VARIFDLVASVPLLAFVSPTALLIPSPKAKTSAPQLQSNQSVILITSSFEACQEFSFKQGAKSTANTLAR
jgi:hypothetical protein